MYTKNLTGSRFRAKGHLYELILLSIALYVTQNIF
jgi:hypothetical protein